MSLKTRFGNLKNVLDEDSSQTEILVLDSPFVANAQFDEMVSHFGDSVSHRLHLPRGRWPPTRCAGAGAYPVEAEDAVRSGAGHIILTDQGQDEANVPMPMILATSAVHSWLTRQGLRTFCSLNVRSAECIDPHYFAVLVGCGATTVNAYLAQDSIADRISRAA
jgi:glutamate synthase (NADPH/NADH) large chain